jgi:hypothetical protein
MSTLLALLSYCAEAECIHSFASAIVLQSVAIKNSNKLLHIIAAHAPHTITMDVHVLEVITSQD